MGVETEPLRLKAYQIEVVGGDQWVLVRPDGRRVDLPNAYHELLKLISQGLALSAIAGWLRTQYGMNGRFERLSRFLIFLHDNDLLADPRAIELAETLRPDYQWRESLAFPEVFDVELFRTRERRPLTSGARAIVTALVGIIALAASVRALQVFAQTEGAVQRIESVWPMLGAFVLAFTASRSLRAIAQFLFINLFSGASTPLRLRAELLSIHLNAEEASRVRTDKGYVIASFAALAASVVPALPEFAALGVPASIAAFLPFFTLIVLLCDLSPFRRSAFTDCLRTLYVYLEAKAQRTSGDTRADESLIRTLHLAFSIVWVIALGLFVVALAPSVVMQIGQLVRQNHRLHGVPATALLLIFTILLASFIDDIITGPSQDQRGAFSIRRLWHRSRVFEAALEDPDRADLEELPLIRQFDQKTKNQLLESAKILDVSTGHEICRQGEPDRSLYIVLAGRFVVSRRSKSGQSRNVAVLERGAVFGEVAFFIGDRRTANVKALSNGRLLMIRHSERLRDLGRERSADLQLRIWFLQGLVANPMFRELPAEAMDALAFAGERCEFKAGEKIICEGEKGDSCFFIVQGRASVTQNFKLINRLGPGDSFGEIALLKPELLRTATIAADTGLIAVKINSQKFWQLLSKHLPLAVVLERLAEGRLRKDTQQFHGA